MKTSVFFTTAVLFFFCSAMSANAGILTYFGVDQSPGGTVPLLGNAKAARTSFLSTLAGVGTENFESFATNNTGPLSMTFPGSSGSLTATLSGTGRVLNTPTTGSFATSGVKYWQTGAGGDFTVSFNKGISAFGFYGTDIGDVQGNLRLTLAGGGSQVITLNTAGNRNGSLLFWGFTDTSNTYTSVAFENTSTGDVFGFDDMTVGDIGQLRAVPEPSSIAVWGIGALGCCFVARRKKKLA